ncbi:aldehyde dehydrogenase family protein [Rhodobacteraceae bacterium]|nr:aldehyde dehydrogenase family protein [Paracoccaceae bacterium]
MEPVGAYQILAQATPDRRIAFDGASRRSALGALAHEISQRESDILSALAVDLNKSESEARLTELLPVLAEIRHVRKNLSRWMAPKRVRGGLLGFGLRARIRPEPKGVALILAPWNYPFALVMQPLVSALAAGCGVLVKPSEHAPATAQVISQIIDAVFGPDLVACTTGGPEVAQAALRAPFNHIFFTGSTRIGREVLRAASDTMASVTLELGGRSPAIITSGADLRAAARHIAWGKFMNAGQTCIAPDHVYVPRDLQARFLAHLRHEITSLYGEGDRLRTEFGRIVTPAQFDRLRDLTLEAMEQGAELAHGGEGDAARLYFPPTVLTHVTDAMQIAQEEVFGPVLPLMCYDDPADLRARLAQVPTPLALYLFTGRQAEVVAFQDQVPAGAMVVNATMVHASHPAVPFGGIGASGQGAAHGEYGFREFSHFKPVVENRFAPIRYLMPPYDGRTRRRIKRLMRHLRA